MTINTDRAQGASSLAPGAIEINLHRATIHDDGKGLGERLDEMAYGHQRVNVTTRHWLSFSKPSNTNFFNQV
jgi:hypothetical protein